MTPATQIKVMVLSNANPTPAEVEALEAVHNALNGLGFTAHEIQSMLYHQSAKHYTLFLGETEVNRDEQP